MKNIFAYILIVIVIIAAGGISVWQFWPGGKIIENGSIQKDDSQNDVGEISSGKIELENCIQVASWEDYYDKKGLSKEVLEIIPELNWVNIPINIPDNLEINLVGDVKIYRFPIATAGGDILSKIIIVHNGNYCEATATNLQKLFAPIERDSVVEYMEFCKVTLGTSLYADTNIILEKKDYDQIRFLLEWDTCPKITEEKKEITRIIEEKENEYIINWVECSPLIQAGCYETKFSVSKNGLIKVLEDGKAFIDCGGYGIQF
ncbi:hypothetical protein KKC63_03325 [Patescibacteria group bacterium]|nr:hypothetical protein [Patescibacteria group bacterium]MBU4023421.1 hypothetical protein [Patescibacteria group bacterium]MBU4077998.1 hypothetical protein [Patescibacteria group bacterium]